MKRWTQVQRFLAVAGLVTVFGAATGRGGSAAAQDTTSCAQIATAAERLACYDRALPPPGPPSGIAAPVEPLQPPSAQPSPLVEGSTSAPAPATSSGTEGERPEATSVVVVGMRKYPGRSASFTTDKGDVWIQIGAEGLYLPKVPFDAELRPASMGTYFLRPSDHGWRVHVRRSDQLDGADRLFMAHGAWRIVSRSELPAPRLWLKAYAVGSTEDWSIEPAPTKRPWMDETHQRIAYRCLPLLAANQAGWIVRCPANFFAVWSGKIDNYGVRLTYAPDSAHLTGTALSHFGSGVLTFVLPWLFRTSPGYGLLVRGMTNEVKDNAVALDGVVESDWSPYTFTMNWKILRAEVPVHFKKGDAVCLLQPFPLDLLERFDCSLESYDSLPPELAKGFQDFVHRRSAASAVAQQGHYETQRDYFAGRYPDGSPAHYAACAGEVRAEREAVHRTTFDLKPFVR